MSYRTAFNALFSGMLFILFAGYGSVTHLPSQMDHSGLLVGAIAAFFVASVIGNLFVRVANLALLDDVNLSVVIRMIGATLLDSILRGSWLGMTAFMGVLMGSQNPFFWVPTNELNVPTAIVAMILGFSLGNFIILSLLENCADIFRSKPEKKKRQQTEQQIEWTIQPEQQPEKYHFSDEHLYRGIRR